ncbi:MAG: hypothetical protein IH625_05910 [Rhodobacteraceae bacterium]|nr:hypothetical protein [Paracoccaceae bacterium]
MADPNLVDFYSRVSRFERARSQGFIHADMADPPARIRVVREGRRRGVLLPFLFVVLCAFGMKGAIHYAVGAQSYEDRVARLQGGEGFDRFGGWLMQADAVTLFVSGQIAHAAQQLKG